MKKTASGEETIAVSGLGITVPICDEGPRDVGSPDSTPLFAGDVIDGDIMSDDTFSGAGAKDSTDTPDAGELLPMAQECRPHIHESPVSEMFSDPLRNSLPKL